ncbi:MAG: DUF4424 family protein [Pirellulaceae bacterium]
MQTLHFPVSRGFAPWLLVGLAVVWPTPARADIAPDPLSGGVSLASNGGATESVAMAAETVRLTLTDRKCSTVATFTMKNLTDSPVEMEVGFPIAYEGDLLGFVAKVNGEVIDNIASWPARREGRDWKRGWKTWKMTFPAAATTMIEVSYHNELQSQYSWNVGLGGRSFDRTILDAAKEEERADLKDRLVCCHAKYILKTGRGWAGPIGRCRVEVTLEEFTTDHLLPNFPHALHESGEPRHAPVVGKNTIVWDVKDYEPESDIWLQFTPRISESEAVALLERFHERSPANPFVVKNLAGYLRAKGRLEEEDALQVALLKRWSNRIALWGPKANDMQELAYSREVLGVVRTMIGMYGEDREARHPERAAEVIRPIVVRLREQIELAPPSDRFVKLFRPQIDRALKWCDEHANAEQAAP